jgi:hypothetical protein
LERNPGRDKWMNCSIGTAIMPTERSSWHHRQAALVIPAFAKLREILVKLGLQRLGDESLRAFAQHLLDRSLAPLVGAVELPYGGVTPGWLLKSDLDTRIPAGHAAFFNASPYTRFSYSSKSA